ncbi:lysylphosphatidylglycerol synthase transmembrane domain-containing protein [Caldisericum exile]|uniref:Hypothetical membrane protein n=1 Tax=Caldisericum exile (strain DSM 21853 / NBRC 104410 / AZM16c01) TaxID=511051 RepID=A0A7U6GFH4_CALEA|nr:lysylphosphatidylglycerol synthase transmembrane domain-containing protein [Caldisericum exile]BAL81448.1 hypothetical membrane protein [Caldisericum exile AZM16c01]
MSNEIISKKTIVRDTILAILAGVIGIIFISLFTHNWNFADLVKSFMLSYIIWAFVFMFLSWFIEAYTIKLVSDVLGYSITMREALKVFLIGGFISRITPFGGGGGEPMQMVILSKEKAIPPGDSAAIISIKMFIGTFVRVSVFLFVPVWILVAKPTWGISEAVNILINTGVIITLALFSALLLIILKPDLALLLTEKVLNTRFFKKIIKDSARQKTIEWVNKTVNEYRTAKDKIFSLKRNTLYFVFFLSFLSWGMILLTPVVLMRGLGIMSPWPEIVITAIIFYISSAYIPTPGGSGTAEIELLALFARLIPNPLIGTFIIAWRFFTHYFLLIAGGITTFLDTLRKKKKSSKPSE